MSKTVCVQVLITPISTRVTYIVGITHPHPDSQSPSHNLITDSSDTRDILLFKRPSNFKRGPLKAAIQLPFFSGTRLALVALNAFI